MVVLEAAGEPGQRRVDVDQLSALMDLLADARPIALYAADRYALQVSIGAASPADALRTAVARWVESAMTIGLAPWELVRAEVISAPEHERDMQGDVAALPSPSAPVRSGPAEGDDLLRLALADPLTDLATPELFRHHLTQVLAADEATHVLLRWDLDDFEQVRRRIGAAAADEVVREMAERLATVIRPGDMVTRLGADEFALGLARTPLPAAVAVAARILTAVEAGAPGVDPFLSLTASMGIALSCRGEGADALLARAGDALAEAKAAGKATWRLSYDADPRPTAAAPGCGAGGVRSGVGEGPDPAS